MNAEVPSGVNSFHKRLSITIGLPSSARGKPEIAEKCIPKRDSGTEEHWQITPCMDARVDRSNEERLHSTDS